MRETPTSGAPAASRLSRLAAVLALSASALLCATGPGHADPLPADIPDYQAALDAVKSPAVRDAVCRFLSVPVPQGGSDTPQSIPDKAEACEGIPAFTLKNPLAVNEITPGFVAGTSQPVATEAVRLSHLVSSLEASVGGRQATVMLAPTQGGGWHLAAVREGDSDAGFAGKAEVGSLVFTEPQIRGWYQLKLLTVSPLNDQAREGLGGRASTSLGEYQKLVKERYADKLTGSEYDTKGFSSGYATAGREAEGSSAPWVVGGASAALVLAGAFLLLHRRRRDTTG
ncbi:hypothetical protein ABZ816_37850 [Actinosynnema sp. NPDC047251]|uniref:Secreted protein n=1 Tax=Saccharothrix espanaensis (strain ATCC 51144 / DSM 44229 / JCM 9112 / NBRC 15066 / NRRL 15764) TaxID=1179773 RepID=K0JW39_SACES|nr:hypothetical protein [Saccharothrix espanaensis]CCH30236.1 hypothetical protein BN6_29260 [Saccharothrix espanaensis DSM 44229]